MPELPDVTVYVEALSRESHTLKRALTDPRLFSGIGNAYSDEILHRARLSPVRLTHQLDDDETARLFEAARQTLRERPAARALPRRGVTGMGTPENTAVPQPRAPR